MNSNEFLSKFSYLTWQKHSLLSHINIEMKFDVGEILKTHNHKWNNNRSNIRSISYGHGICINVQVIFSLCLQSFAHFQSFIFKKKSYCFAAKCSIF